MNEWRLKTSIIRLNRLPAVLLSLGIIHTSLSQAQLRQAIGGVLIAAGASLLLRTLLS